MIFPYEDFDLKDVRTYPLDSRASKAKAADFAKPCGEGATMASFLDSLPNMLGAADFRAVVGRSPRLGRTIEESCGGLAPT